MHVADKDPELLLIHDLLYGDIYLICVVDGFILNRSSGILENMNDTINDFDILKRFFQRIYSGYVEI